MPTNDSFKGVNFTAGQEVRAQDLIDAQRFFRSKLYDAVLERLTVGPAQAGSATGMSKYEWTGKHGTNVPSSYWAYTLHGGQAYPRQGSANNKIQIAPGTLFQKVAVHDGNEETYLPYTFEGTEEVTIANGDVANPRVDIIQMKLELITTDLQARVTVTPGIKASRDLNPLTANCETVIRARAAGFGGNAISIQFVADGAGAGSLTQSGYQLVFHYQSGVTTVANFETAVQASALIEVQTVDGVGTLTSPGDTFGPVFLTGGTDQVLSSSNVNMKRRVQCTLSVKQGTAAATPRYPSPDAGYVTVAAVVVPTAFAWGTGLVFDGGLVPDDLANPILHDQRMPMGVPKRRTCHAREIFADNGATVWALSAKNEFLTAGAGKNNLYAVCPGGRIARCLGIQITGTGAMGTSASRYRFDNNGTNVIGMNNTTNAENNATGQANVICATSDREYMEANHIGLSGGTVLPSLAAPFHGPPIWSSGRRVAVVEGDASLVLPFSKLCLIVSGTTSLSGAILHSVEFIVAEGL